MVLKAKLNFFWFKDKNIACESSNNIILDCKGKMCYNRGILNYNTCTCECPKMRLTPNGEKGDALYTGSSCENSESAFFNFQRNKIKSCLEKNQNKILRIVS